MDQQIQSPADALDYARRRLAEETLKEGPVAAGMTIAFREMALALSEVVEGRCVCHLIENMRNALNSLKCRRHPVPEDQI